MIMAGLRANFEFDLKKVIALSTLRQLGLIIRTVGAGLPGVAFFHLLSHALFKALLFICAGLVIHRVGDTQDIRAMGGILWAIPVVGCLMAVANLALCGAPFLTGFYSKDLILELFVLGGANPLLFVVYSVATGLTVSYTWRLLHLRFGGVCHLTPSHICGEGVGIGPRSLTFLGAGAVVGGSLLSWTILPAPSTICLPPLIKGAVLLVSLVGVLGGLIITKFASGVRAQAPP